MEEAPEALELVGELNPYVLRGGKRLRPALVYHSYRACGGEDDTRVLPAALAVELLHTYLLIHDDIMDQADTRRGEPSAHLLFRDAHRSRGWSGDADRHGVSVAILLGDLFYSYAVELFFSTEDSGSNGVGAGCFSEMCQEVIVGQYLELTALNHRELELEDLLRVLRMKSGRYSAERPIQLGALLAGAGDTLVEGLSHCGLQLGEAFQLRDDILGLFGDSDTVGKSVSSDLSEGKHTVLIHETLRKATESDAAVVRSALGNPTIGAGTVERVRAAIVESGALAEVEEMIERRLARAARTLEGLDLTEGGKTFFEGLIAYLRERRS